MLAFRPSQVGTDGEPIGKGITREIRRGSFVNKNLSRENLEVPVGVEGDEGGDEDFKVVEVVIF